MIKNNPTAVMRSVGISLEQELIDRLDDISAALAVDGEVPSRSDTARRLLHFGTHLIQSKSPKVAPLLKEYEDDLASSIELSA